MEKGEDEQQLELPPGFRFYPSDEELVTHYLAPKVSDSSFLCLAIGEADLNKCEPWDLPWKAKMGEKEWYFFSLKDRKYPTGLRTNRATDSGYWKATGKDKEIYKMKAVVGMKKTLVFYRGRAPKGEKTNWVMHEFRLDSNYSTKNFPKANNNEWVISRVFDKCSGGKKTHLAANGKTISPHPPPLMDPSPNQSGTEEDGSHVTGFSTPLETQSQKTKEELAVDSHSVIQIQLPPSLSNSFTPVSQRFPETPLLDYTYATQFSTHLQPGSLVMQNQASILRNMLESRKWNNNWTLKTEPQQAAGISGNTNNNSQPNGQTFHEMPVMSQGDYSAAAGQSSDLDSVWNYFMQ